MFEVLTDHNNLLLSLTSRPPHPPPIFLSTPGSYDSLLMFKELAKPVDQKKQMVGSSSGTSSCVKCTEINKYWLMMDACR